MLRPVDQGKLGRTRRCGRYLLALHKSDLGFASRSFVLAGYGSSLSCFGRNFFHTKTSQKFIIKGTKSRLIPSYQQSWDCKLVTSMIHWVCHNAAYHAECILPVREGTLTRGAFLFALYFFIKVHWFSTRRKGVLHLPVL